MQQNNLEFLTRYSRTFLHTLPNRESGDRSEGWHEPKLLSDNLWYMSTIYEAWIHDYTWLYTCKIQDTWQWALSLRHEHMTIHNCTIYTCLNTWLCMIVLMKDTIYMTIRDCTYTMYIIHVWYMAVSIMAQERDEKKISSLSFFSTSIGWSWVHMKYEKTKAHPWQLCRSLHWVWGSRPGDLWAIGSTKMTS